SFGLSVQTAADGDEALETLREEEYCCSAVLLAAFSDERNSCDTIETIRGQEAFQTLPILVLDAAADPDREARYRRSGADGCLCKPIDRDELETALTRVLTPQQHPQRQTA
ncbi:MAG: response regulator, partial [Candidatus Thiodiazotropha sp.]